MEDLGSKLKTGVKFGFYTKLLTYVSQFIFGIILARLLSPEDYGLAGMLAFFIAFYEMLVDSGFGNALIQKKKPADIDYDTVFWFNFGISLILYLILFISSPYIADFYDDSRLIVISRVLGLVPIINAFGSVQGKYLNKNLKFKSLAKISYISFVSSSIFAVILAYTGFGVWSLVYKSIFMATVVNFGWWIISDWKPKMKFSFNSLRKLFKFGSKLLLDSVFDVVFNNLYSLIIGKYFNPASLGFYTKAKQLNDLPDNVIRISTSHTLFPALSHIQDDDEQLRGVYKKVLSLLAFVLFPVYAILFCIAYPMIEVLLTNKWIVSAQYLQIMCFIVLAYPFEVINGNLIYVKGKSNYVLIVSMISRFIFICLILVLISHGILGLIYAYIIYYYSKVILYIYFARKLFNYGILQQIKDVSIFFFFTIISLVVMIPLNYLSVSPLIKLILIIVSGSGVYVLISYLLKAKEMSEIIKLIKLKS